MSSLTLTQLERRIRIHVVGHGGGQQQLHDPVAGFPFSWWSNIIYEPNRKKADLVWQYFGEKPYSAEVGVAAKSLEHLSGKELSKYVWYTLCDFPRFVARYKSGLKFVLSPPPGNDAFDNALLNIHPVPTHACVNDYELQKDIQYTDYVRTLPKKYDFGFIGNITGDIPSQFFGGRQWMTELGLDNALFVNRAGSAFLKGWLDAHRKWMERMASCRYGFAPAGPSNGPRGFWLMQVGCVPIFSDVTHLPFEDRIAWKDIAVFVDSKTRLSFDYSALPTGREYELMRQGCTEAWDKYLRMDSCARECGRITCEYLSRADAGS